MESGRFNIVLGLVVMVASAFIGVALGQSMEQYYVSGYAQIPLWRHLASAGHTHSMPFGLINIVFGLLLARAECSSGVKKAASVLTALSLCLPLGTGLRGVTQGAPFTEIIAMVGGLSMLAACALMIRLQWCRKA